MAAGPKTALGCSIHSAAHPAGMQSNNLTLLRSAPFPANLSSCGSKCLCGVPPQSFCVDLPLRACFSPLPVLPAVGNHKRAQITSSLGHYLQVQPRRLSSPRPRKPILIQCAFESSSPPQSAFNYIQKDSTVQNCNSIISGCDTNASPLHEPFSTFSLEIRVWPVNLPLLSKTVSTQEVKHCTFMLEAHMYLYMLTHKDEGNQSLFMTFCAFISLS